jgi:hypothetical protein
MFPPVKYVIVILALLLPACDVQPGDADACGSFSGSSCERIVQCCDFAQQTKPTGAAANACLVKRPVAEQALATSGKADDAQCDAMISDPQLAECELSCEGGTGTSSASGGPN